MSSTNSSNGYTQQGTKNMPSWCKPYGRRTRRARVLNPRRGPRFRRFVQLGRRRGLPRRGSRCRSQPSGERTGAGPTTTPGCPANSAHYFWLRRHILAGLNGALMRPSSALTPRSNAKRSGTTGDNAGNGLPSSAATKGHANSSTRRLRFVIPTVTVLVIQIPLARKLHRFLQ